MLKVREAIVVEGRYDRHAIASVVDGCIIETSGFGIMRDKDKLKLLRRLADERGLLILTDSDGAGFLIRNFLKGAVNTGKVKHAYIPDVNGREKRKSSPSKEGKLGVEGMAREVLIEAILRSGATVEEKAPDTCKRDRLTKADLFELGLYGGVDSASKRRELLMRLELPERLSTNAMLDVLGALMTREKLFETVRELDT